MQEDKKSGHIVTIHVCFVFYHIEKYVKSMTNIGGHTRAL
jgi:hypothetical protein